MAHIPEIPVSKSDILAALDKAIDVVGEVYYLMEEGQQVLEVEYPDDWEIMDEDLERAGDLLQGLYSFALNRIKDDRVREADE